MTAYSLINSWLNFSWTAINIKLHPSSKLPCIEILTLLPQQFSNLSNCLLDIEVKESALMPGYKVCYFTEQGWGLNLSKTENVHHVRAPHLHYSSH